MDEKQKEQVTSVEPQDGKELTEGEMEDVVGGQIHVWNPDGPTVVWEGDTESQA